MKKLNIIQINVNRCILTTDYVNPTLTMLTRKNLNDIF